MPQAREAPKSKKRLAPLCNLNSTNSYTRVQFSYRTALSRTWKGCGSDYMREATLEDKAASFPHGPTEDGLSELLRQAFQNL